jgi:hypothetical protein
LQLLRVSIVFAFGSQKERKHAGNYKSRGLVFSGLRGWRLVQHRLDHTCELEFQNVPEQKRYSQSVHIPIVRMVQHTMKPLKTDSTNPGWCGFNPARDVIKQASDAEKRCLGQKAATLLDPSLLKRLAPPDEYNVRIKPFELIQHIAFLLAV